MAVHWLHHPFELALPGPHGAFHTSVHELADGLVVGLHEDTCTRLFVIDLSKQHSVATVDWPAGAQVRVRECGSTLLFHDDQGRLLQLQTPDCSTRHISLQ